MEMLKVIIGGLLFLLVLRGVTMEIARRTADEIERRNKPLAATAKQPSVFLSPRLALIGSSIGAIGLVAMLARWW